MLAAVKPVRAEDYARAFSDSVGSFELRYTFITVFCGGLTHLKFLSNTTSCVKLHTFSDYIVYNIAQKKSRKSKTEANDFTSASAVG